MGCRHPTRPEVLEELLRNLHTNQRGVAGLGPEQGLHGKLSDLAYERRVFEPPRTRTQSQVELGVEVVSLRRVGQPTSGYGFAGWTRFRPGDAAEQDLEMNGFRGHSWPGE